MCHYQEADDLIELQQTLRLQARLSLQQTQSLAQHLHVLAEYAAF